MREKFNSIDLFKFLLAIVVVVFHTNPLVHCESKLINDVVIFWADVSVPFFFIASGYLLAVGWGDTCVQRERYIQKTLVSTVLLYITWTLVSLPLTIYGYAISGNRIIDCIFSYIKHLFFVGKLYNSYHLWYLLAMIYALLVMWVLIHKERGTKHIFITGIVLYAACLVFAWIRREEQIKGLLTAASKMFYLVFNSGGVFTGMLYMSIGICIREHSKLGILTSVGGIAAGVLVRYGLSHELGNILSSAMFFILVINIKFPNHPCYIVLRNLSKYIYLTHLLCFSFYTFIVIGQPNKLGVDSFLAKTVLSTVISSAIIYLKGLWRTKAVNGAK